MSAASLSVLPCRVVTTVDSEEGEKAVLGAAKDIGAGQVKVEKITSFYWWKGLQSDSETRISFDAKAFDAAMKAVQAVHSYDVPMILCRRSEQGAHSMGTLRGDHGRLSQMGRSLVEKRLVACAQLVDVDAETSELVVKTATSKIGDVERHLQASPFEWNFFAANEAYAKWVIDETETSTVQ